MKCSVSKITVFDNDGKIISEISGKELEELSVSVIAELIPDRQIDTQYLLNKDSRGSDISTPQSRATLIFQLMESESENRKLYFIKLLRQFFSDYRPRNINGKTMYLKQCKWIADTLFNYNGIRKTPLSYQMIIDQSNKIARD